MTSSLTGLVWPWANISCTFCFRRENWRAQHGTAFEKIYSVISAAVFISVRDSNRLRLKNSFWWQVRQLVAHNYDKVVERTMEVNFLGLRRRSPRRFLRRPVGLSRTRCLKERLGACIIVLCPFSFHKRNNRFTKMSAQPSHTNWSWISIGWLHKGVVLGAYPHLLSSNGLWKEAMTWKALIILKLIGAGDWEGEICVSESCHSLTGWPPESHMSIKKGIRRLQKSKIWLTRKEMVVSVENLSIL